MLIKCPSCDWKFYLKDKENECPMCGETLPFLMEVEDLDEYEDEGEEANG